MEVNRARTAGRPRKGDGTLDRDRIVAAAWALVDAEGLAALSTRALAAALRVKQPALYWYVGSKDELLGLMMERLLADSIADLPHQTTWREWLRLVAHRQRAALLAHRDSGMVASLAPPSATLRTEIFPRILAPLRAGGLSDEEASAAAGGIAALVLGWVIYEQRPETRAFVLAFHDPDTGFEVALDYFIRGIAAAKAA